VSVCEVVDTSAAFRPTEIEVEFNASGSFDAEAAKLVDGALVRAFERRAEIVAATSASAA
jgi:hypothetical protein